MTLVASDTRRGGDGLVAGARPPRSADSTPAGNSRRLVRWLLAQPLYSLTLGYRAPRSFFAVAPDSWPGDATEGRRLLAGEYIAHGIVGEVLPTGDDPPWQRPDANPLWLAALNSFGWLRDLRDSGETGAAQLAVRLIDDWSEREWRWSPQTWRRDVTAARLVSWIRHYDWLAAAADQGFSGRFVASLARQRVHLRRIAQSGLSGHETVAVMKALVFADLAFVHDGKTFDKSLEHTLARLSRFLKRYVLHDGVVAERAPHLQVEVLRDLIDIKAALISAERQAPAELVAAIDRLAPILSAMIADGRASGPAKPWLGMTTDEIRGRLFVSSVTPDGPADKAGIKRGDLVVSVNGDAPKSLADFYRKVWAQGAAGTAVPLDVLQGSGMRRIDVKSMNRMDHLKLKSTF